MRKELEIIETIEKYLQGQLTGTEKAAFEAQLAQSRELQEQVAAQRVIMQALDRALLRQKAQQAGRKFQFRKNFFNGGSAGLIIITVVVATILYKHPKTEQSFYTPASLPTYNEAGIKDWADADKQLTAQVFNLNPTRDTVIESKKGIVLSIPAQSFLDEDGHPVAGSIQVIIKEALDPAAIIRAGLSTRAGDTLLETGGMFFIDARKDGRTLKINPAASIIAEVPADTIKPGMNVYQGVRKNDGSIDWTNPRPLNHDLVPVDIRSLDFYPPHYLDSLGKWGYDRHNRKFTDSLYFSLSDWFGEGMVELERDSTRARKDSFLSDYQHFCGLNPAKVRAIWNEKFQNTILATREFEERMRLLHKIGGDHFPDFYVKNIDKNLSDIDSMAALGESAVPYAKELLAFYARHDGKIAGDPKKWAKLREYYEMKSTLYREAAIKTQTEYWEKRNKLDSIADEKTRQHQEADQKRMAANFKKELEINLKNALKQLGRDTNLVPLPPVQNNYSVTIITTGWCNIDRAVMESTVSRNSLDYTDPQTGKKATIAYTRTTVTIANKEKYERCQVYLLPNRLSSFMRLADSNGTYSEKLNQSMVYKLVCIGYKNDRIFLYAKDSIEGIRHGPLELKEVSKAELAPKLTVDLKQETEFQHFELTDNRRRRIDQEHDDLRERIYVLIFACIADDGSAQLDRFNAK